MVADLQAYRAEFAEEFNGWLNSRREMDALHSQHARELLGMQKRLDDAHVTEVAELTRRLNEEKSASSSIISGGSYRDCKRCKRRRRHRSGRKSMLYR